MKAVKLLTSIIVLFLVSFLVSEAQDILNPPANFNGEIVKTNDGLVIKLTWESNEEGIIPDVYNLYMIFGDSKKLNMIGQVHYQDNIKNYEYIFHNLHSGNYTFFAKAAKFDSHKRMIESEKSDEFNTIVEEKPFIRFESKPNIYAKIGEKYIYKIKASSNINCKIVFELIDYPEGMQIKDNVIYWQPKKNGEYKVSVKAYFHECNVEMHSVQSFLIKVGSEHNEAFVKLMIEPEIKAMINKAFHYPVRYETNVDCSVNLEFVSEVPDGMIIEQGIITWIHPQMGKYKIGIKATLDCKPDVFDINHFLLIVVNDGGSNHFCANIVGEISFDENDNLVQDGLVQAWKLDRNDFENKRMFMGQIQNGEFAINLPEGNYALNIIGKAFVPEWYEDAKFITDAKRIEIACNDEVTINAKVEALPQPKLYNVSGRVYDAETNNPLLAMVEFIPVHKAFNDFDPDMDKTRFATKTDADGNYSIQLPDNFTYIAHAISATNSNQYQNNFYNNVSNPMEADLINLTSDVKDIDFAMKPMQKALGGFSGTVKNKEGSPLVAKVIAILVSGQSDFDHKFSQTVETVREGIYHFNHLPPGKYVVMSIPEDKHYIPGYYKMNDFAVLKWKEATIIEIGDMNIDIMYDIIHRERSKGGVAQIGGSIFANGGNLIKDNNSQTANPIAGAFIHVVDTEGNISDYTFSDTKGFFNLSDVTQGNLILVADKVGYNSFEIPVETNYYEKANVQLNVQLQEDITGVSDLNNSNGLLIYPTPASNQAMLEFNSNSIKTQIDILNIQGVLLKTMSVNTIKGMNKINIDLRDLSNGFYFIKISDNNNIKTSPLIILR